MIALDCIIKFSRLAWLRRIFIDGTRNRFLQQQKKSSMRFPFRLTIIMSQTIIFSHFYRERLLFRLGFCELCARKMG